MIFFPDPVLTLFRELDRRRLTLSTAESLTGGLLGARLTAIAGSSRVYWGGVISYSNASKERFCAVPKDLIDHHGPVSREVVSAMAEGILTGSGADCAVAVSGVAGPGPSADGVSAGTVWIAVAVLLSRTKTVLAEEHHFSGGRNAVRRKTVNAACRQLMDILTEPNR